MQAKPILPAQGTLREIQGTDTDPPRQHSGLQFGHGADVRVRCETADAGKRKVIGIADLIACGIAPTQARLYFAALQQTMAKFDINTKGRIAAFLAQTAHESANYTRTEESLYYTTPERIRAMWPTRVPSLQDASTLCRKPQALANRVYANRLGNGDGSSNDGWNYRGRGLIQITGRTNYHVAGDALRVNYLSAPNLVSMPFDACMTAGWFWSSIHGNDLADASLIDDLTRRINGVAMAGADDRRSRYDDALQALA